MTNADTSFLTLLDRVNRNISPSDSLYPGYPEEEYFKSGLRQLDAIDALLRVHRLKRLSDHHFIADYACHYGRLLRCLRAALPDATLHAYDLEPEAVEFCAREFRCVPVVTGWRPRNTSLTNTYDLVISVSLVTHTRLAFFRDVLSLWERMLRPGAFLFFTYLGERYLNEWVAGRLRYGQVVTPEAISATLGDFRRDGHAFCGSTTTYSEKGDYGIAFMRDSVVVDEVARRTALRLVTLQPGDGSPFGQDLAVVRKASWRDWLPLWRRHR